MSKTTYHLLLGATVCVACFLVCAAGFGQEAVIVGPTSAPAGYPVIFETTGSSGTLYEWGVITDDPLAPTQGMILQDRGRRVVFASPVQGVYVFTLAIDKRVATNHFLTLKDGIPPPDPPPPLPAPIDLEEHVKRRTAEVQAKLSEFPEVSQVFFVLSRRIDKGELRGSKAIDEATVEVLFGKDGDQRENWQSWYTSVSAYMMSDMNLMGQDEWSAAYFVISESVSR